MIVAIDYETMDSRGASFEYFRKDFKVFSLSCAWRDEEGNIKQWFSNKENKIKLKLADLARAGYKIVAHNLPYEYAVTKACYPNIKLNWYADTMRLAQFRDGGGDEFNPPELSFEQSIALELGEISEKEASRLRYKGIGLSLEACAKRFIDDVGLHDHKSSAHKWLEENHKIKSKHGQYLHLLPYNLLEEYNNADTLVTLLLYESCIDWATKQKLDWQRDHKLYFMRAELITGAYYKGIKIDQEALGQYITEIEEEVAQIEREFLDFCRPYLTRVGDIRYKKLMAWVHEAKTFKGRLNRWWKVTLGEKDDEWCKLNIGSSNQLRILFQDVMGIQPVFFTKKGAPSFRTVHLHQWGKAGKILQKRRKRLLVLQQCVNTYISTLYDGRVHCSVKVAGTRTNRVAGGRL